MKTFKQFLENLGYQDIKIIVLQALNGDDENLDDSIGDFKNANKKLLENPELYDIISNKSNRAEIIAAIKDKNTIISDLISLISEDKT